MPKPELRYALYLKVKSREHQNIKKQTPRWRYNLML